MSTLNPGNIGIIEAQQGLIVLLSSLQMDSGGVANSEPIMVSMMLALLLLSTCVALRIATKAKSKALPHSA